MRLDRSHFSWAIFTLFLTGVATVLYLAARHDDPNEPFGLFGLTISLPDSFRDAAHRRNTVGAKPMGLAFGILAFAIFLFASALGIRKKRRLWPIGNVQTWLKAHIWLTIFTIPLVLFHSGFQLGGAHTTVLFWLYAIVMISGFYGLALQQFMPRMMKETLSREVVYEQIPNIRARIYEEALAFRGATFKEVRASKAAPAEDAEGEVVVFEQVDPSPQVLVDFLDEEGLPFLRNKRAQTGRLADESTSDEVFKLLKLNVTEGYRAKVDDLQMWCDEHRLMARQAKLHHILHSWLLVHVPLSFALIIWTIWHAYITWAYL